MSDENRKRRKTITGYQDILDKLFEELDECEGNLQREHLAIRRAWDEVWGRIFDQSTQGDYNYFYRNIYTEFSNEVERRRSQRSQSQFNTSLITRPKRQQRNGHQSCVDIGYWMFFHNLLRSNHGKIQATHLLCCITYSDGTTECFTIYNQPGDHAEILALDRIKERLENSSKTINRIAMYITRSPCGNCCEQINKFITSHPNLREFYIRFTSVFEHYNQSTMNALRELRESSDRVNIGIFQERDWNTLESHLTDSAYNELREQFSTGEVEESENEESTESEEDDHVREHKQNKGNDEDGDKGGNAGRSKDEKKGESRRNEEESEDVPSSSSYSDLPPQGNDYASTLLLVGTAILGGIALAITGSKGK